MKLEEMPVLRPIPIKTKDKHFFIRIFRWITSIRKWKLEEDWYYTLPDGKEIMIPEGFNFDGASVPRPLWGILSPVGLLLIPGLVHDYAYKYKELICIEKGKRSAYMRGSKRTKWDNLFKRIAVDVNGFALINRVAWLFLILFGWHAWNKQRKLDKNRKNTELLN
jgi:hypothetical protein